MHPTKNDLPESARAKICELLNSRLADAADLQSHSKQAHWNVKGPNFIALHKLFDEVYGLAGEWVDEIAERIVQLGGQAFGTLQAAAKSTTLPEYPLDITRSEDHVRALTDSLAYFGKSIRAAIDQTDGWGDKDTADLCTEVSREVDKMLWFVESHIL